MTLFVSFIANAEYTHNLSFFVSKTDKKRKMTVRPFYRKLYPAFVKEVEKEIKK